MKGLKTKLQLIYWPFIIVSLSFIVCYSLLSWVLFIKNDFFKVKEDVVHTWMPLGLAGIPVIIWLRSRINLLHFKRENAAFLYQLIAALAMAWPTVVALSYLETATGRLTRIGNINAFEKSPKTKYYAIDKYCVDNSNAGVLKTATVSGKYNQDLDFIIYATLPIFENISDTTKGECSYWIGKKYFKTISNRVSEPEKDSELKAFVKAVRAEIDTTNFERFVYLKKEGNTEDRDQFEKSTVKSELVHYKDPTIFTAINAPFENRNDGKFGWIFKALWIGCLLFFILLIITPLQETV
ncbi:MAG: rhomboid family intrarane serine protease [Ferruginibacter sp.]|nr:rhomboid family intrarane serine protease [Ferruginibacter sp.]